MKKLSLPVVSILLLLSVAACGQGNSETSGEEEHRVVSVEVDKAVKGGLTIERAIFGRAAASQLTPVVIQAAGEVDELRIEIGDQVDKDDVLMTINTLMGKQTIRAPRDGEIIHLTASTGETVSSEEPIATIGDLNEMKLEFNVTAGVRDLFVLDKSYPVIINDKDYEAMITGIDKLPNEAGLYPVTATMSNQDGAVLPGMVAELAVTEQQIEGAIIVPTASIVEENDETFVYVVKNGEADKQSVTVVETQSTQTAIEGNVQAGDEIVVTGQLILSDGVQVNVAKGE